MAEEITQELIQEIVDKSISSLNMELIIITVSVSAALSIIALFFTIKQHNENTAIQAFQSITELIDTDKTLFFRRIIYSVKDDWSFLIKKFSSCIPKPKPWDIELRTEKSISNELKIIDKTKKDTCQEQSAKINNHVAWQTAVNYDQVCFLLSQNKHLRKEIIKFHGATILKVYIITQGLMKRWKEERGRSDHAFFEKIACHIWRKCNDQRRHAIANLITSQENIYIRKDGINEPDSIDVINFKKWGNGIFKECNDKSRWKIKTYAYQSKKDEDDLNILKALERKTVERNKGNTNSTQT